MYQIKLRLTVFVALLLLRICAPRAFAQETPLPDPEKPGAYPVGVTTILLVDHSRTDPATNGPRSLITEIWYPAEEDARGLPKNRRLDFFLKNKAPEFSVLLQVAFGVDVVQADARFQNMAVRDTRLRDGVYPLPLFSHGNGGLRMQNAFWCEHMASHGYIVMSPDHTGNCAVTFIDGKMVMFENSDEGRKRLAADRPNDLSFLIEAMGRMNKGGDSRFFGRVDLEHIGPPDTPSAVTPAPSTTTLPDSTLFDRITR
jgi:predicted dienelactone hydrolase